MKSLYTFLLSMLFCLPISGQFSLVLEGGANYGSSTFTGETNGRIVVGTFSSEIQEFHRVLGYFLAAAPFYKLSDRIRVGTEFQYSKEGYGSGLQEFGQSMELHYIRVIPEIQLKILGPLHLIAGMNVGCLGAQSFKNFQGDRTGVEYLAMHNRLDLGLLTALKIDVSGLTLSIKYNYGLVAIDTFEVFELGGQVLGETQLKNRFLQFGIGYRINVKI